MFLSSVMPAEQQLNGCVLSTTAIAAWQDWVSAVKVDKKANGNVGKLMSLAGFDPSQRSSKARRL
jgi:hypothetical protein